MERYFCRIEKLEEIDSTNSYLLTSEFESKTVVYSFHQTAGRGRLNRSWKNFPSKNLALSVGIRDLTVNPLWLTAGISLALIDTLAVYSLSGAWIKWPNDVYIENRKIAGVLTESQWKEGRIDKSVVGIGVNLNPAKTELERDIPGRQTTSLFCETKENININNFVRIFLDNIVNYLQLIDRSQIVILREKWMNRSEIIGKNAELSRGSGVIYGKVTGIDEEGFLYFDDGTKTFRVVSGDLKVITKFED